VRAAEPVVVLAGVRAAEQAGVPERVQALARVPALVRALALVPVAELLLKLQPVEAEAVDLPSRHLLVRQVFPGMYLSTPPTILMEP